MPSDSMGGFTDSHGGPSIGATARAVSGYTAFPGWRGQVGREQQGA